MPIRPAMEAAATSVIPNSSGRRRRSPPSSRMSVMPVAWSMIPTTMNSAPLYRTWLAMCRRSQWAPPGGDMP